MNTPDIQEFYSKFVSVDELAKHAKIFGLNVPEVIEQEVVLFDLSKRESILEIGPGSGRLISKILETGAKYTGIDVTPEYVAHCLSKFPETCVFKGDFFEYDFGRSKYDRVVFPWTVLSHYNFSRQRVAIEKAKSILHKKGKIFVNYRDSAAVKDDSYPSLGPIDSSEFGMRITAYLSSNKNACLDFYLHHGGEFFCTLAKELEMKLEFKSINNEKFDIDYAILSWQ